MANRPHSSTRESFCKASGEIYGGARRADGDNEEIWADRNVVSTSFLTPQEAAEAASAFIRARARVGARDGRRETEIFQF